MPVLSISVALYLGLLPLLHTVGSWPSLTAHDLARTAQLPLLLLGAVAALRPAVWQGVIRQSWPLMGIGVVCGLALLSSWQAQRPDLALREVCLMLGLVALALSLRAELRRHGVTCLMRGLVLGTAVHGLLYVIVLLWSGFSAAADAGSALMFGYDNPRFLNHVQTLAIPLLAAMATQREEPRQWRVLAALGLCVSCFILINSMGRATLLALCCGWVSVLWLIGRRAWPWLWMLLVSLLIPGALAGWLQWSLASSTAAASGLVTELSSSHSRAYLWHLAVQQWQASPWLGAGPMHFASVMNDKGAHPHNQYLQWLAELGAPATLLLLLLAMAGLGWVARGARRIHSKRTAMDGFACGLLAALVGAAVDAGFSGNLVMPLSQVLFVAVAAMAGAHFSEATPVSAASMNFSWAGVGVMLAMLWLTKVSVDDLQRPGAPVLTPAAGVELQHIRPRYWSHGWF